MNGRTPFLSLAIEARLDRDCRLVSADPHLMRIHKANGGLEQGVLAVPQLLALAMLAWRTGAAIERSVMVADGDTDIQLWVNAKRNSDHVHLSISGWQEVAGRHYVSAPRIMAPTVRGTGDPDLLLDMRLAIIAFAPRLLDTIGLHNIGRSISDIFKFDPGLSAETLGSDALVVGEHRRLHLPFELRFVSLQDADNRNSGFGCWLQPVANEPAESAIIESGKTNIGFGHQFASAVRQPLSRIIANAETIGAHVNGPIKESYAGYALDIASAARHLSELVSDLEDLDAIDRADFKVASEKVELNDIARRVAGLLALKAADHHITIELPDEQEKVEVVGEFRRILQIVLNLTGNAIRYAPDGSIVSIAVSTDPHMLSVSDQGAGIDPENREQVFEKFERLGRSGDGGSGLGLYISRRLARAMKGDLVVGESASGGAKFTLHLPPFSPD